LLHPSTHQSFGVTVGSHIYNKYVFMGFNRSCRAR
jgi:hypothetical protein